jgi:hypothetical protein
MKGLCEAFGSYLISRFPTTKRITTTDKAPEFAVYEYQALLADLGFKPIARVLYGKDWP